MIKVIKMGLWMGLALFMFTEAAFGAEGFSPESYQENVKSYYKKLIKAQGFESSLAQFQGEFQDVAKQFEVAADEYLRAVGSARASELNDVNADFLIHVDETVRKYLVGIIFSLDMDKKVSIPELAAVQKQIMEESFLRIEAVSSRVISLFPNQLKSLSFRGFLTGPGGDYHSVGQVSVREMMALVKFMNGEFRASSECAKLIR